jgi:hypothetical protein
MDNLKVLNMAISNKEYLKTKSGRDGYIEKPYKELTDELINHYSEESRIEAEKINPILEASPHLFTADNELSMWNSIFYDLNSLNISNDLSKLYDYKGGQFTLSSYLAVRGGVEGNALMVALSHAVNVALLKVYYLFHGDINGLAKVSDYAYYSGKMTHIAEAQNEIIAGQSRTGKATDAKISLKKERINIAISEAKKLRKTDPRIFKVDISQLICEKVGVRASTVHGYLKGVNLSG